MSCLAGLVILYLPSDAPTPHRMITMLVCSFGFLLSYATGIIFSFNFIVSTIVFGLFTTAVHWITLYFQTRPPGSFFFIMTTSMSSSVSFDPSTIAEKLGFVVLGTMFACLLALIYSLFSNQSHPSKSKVYVIAPVNTKKQLDHLAESLIVGFFLFLSLLTAHLLRFDNPYWIPISCAAIMQGVSLYHVWQRAFHRITGTFIGLGLCWVIISLDDSPLYYCICIMILQFIIEMLIVRHYALAVVFITCLTILLAEAGNPLIATPNLLIQTRFIDIILGSSIGAIGGWFIHHEQIRQQALHNLRETRMIIKKKGRKNLP